MTNREKVTSHINYDEAHYTMTNKPLGAMALINNGYGNRVNQNQEKPETIEIDDDKYAVPHQTKLYVKRLSDKAKLPVRATIESAGLDIFSAEDVTISPGEIKLVKTDISIICPKGSYGRLAPRSGLTVKKKIDIRAGVIDADYRGEVLVTVHNIGTEKQFLACGSKIAQLIIEKVANVTICETATLNETTRGKNGFGSTDLPPSPTPPQTVDAKESNMIPYDDDEFDHPVVRSISTPLEDIYLSSSPFGPTITIETKLQGVHPTLGLKLDDRNTIGRLTLLECEKGTPSAKIKKWRSTLRYSNLIEVNGKPVKAINEVEQEISQSRKEQKSEVSLTFATDEKIPVHIEKGVPQLYFDQLNVIAEILQEIRYDAEFLDVECEPPVVNLLRKKRNNAQFTRRELKRRKDWYDWQESEKKQLDLYEIQSTFGPPVKPPPNVNILDLLWAYAIKTDGTKKSRCVCNGSPRRKGAITLAHTFAACLEQPGSRVFWACAAYLQLLVIGADASNAFAEAPPPVAPLYVTVDQQFREWWENKGREPIPEGYVVQVLHALQGHPESPRLWATMIDKIIREIAQLKPCTHEPCLYYGIVDNEIVLFLRQVDDFAVACRDPNIANNVIDIISSQLSAPMKKLGVISRYNGVDVDQCEDYIKIHHETYLRKVLDNHEWLNDTFKPPQNPIPMKESGSYQKILDLAIPPANEKEAEILSKEMGFTYRQVLGEVLFCMVTCRPDISFAVIKLSKFAVNPAKEHYLAMKYLCRYLRATISDGIIYWRKSSQNHEFLKKSTIPQNFHQKVENPNNDSKALIGSADSDWATDYNDRKSVTGFVMYFAEGAVHYKTKFQREKAFSSTEAELVAACEAGKAA